jgi:CRP/FNR family transcriptional regulator, anaerobic regulatory protein
LDSASAATIAHFKPFRHLAAAGRLVLEHGLRYASFAKAASVLRKGQRVSGAFVVVSGQLRVYTVAPNGKEATLYLIDPGETCVLALNCIFSDLLYPAWVEASAATKLAIVGGPEYRILFESEPAIRNMTVQAFSTIVFRLMAELEELHTHKLEQRLIGFLLLHANAQGVVQITQQAIGSHLGSTREVIARALAQLAAAGHVRTGRRQIVLTDPAKLAKIAQPRDTPFKPGTARKRPRR